MIQSTFSGCLVVLPDNLLLSLSLWFPPMGLKGFPLHTSCSALTKQPSTAGLSRRRAKPKMSHGQKQYEMVPIQQMMFFLKAVHTLGTAHQFMNVQLPPPPHECLLNDFTSGFIPALRYKDIWDFVSFPIYKKINYLIKKA